MLPARTPTGRSRCDEPDDWVRALTRAGSERHRAIRTLHGMLLAIARSDALRRAPTLALTGPELDDVVHQAADDALVAIVAKLPTFRGESRFTTWAYKFVVFEVGIKINRHRWHREAVASDETRWEMLPDRLGLPPEQEAQWHELVAGVRRAIDELTPRQRGVFVAIVVDGVPLDVLTERIGSNRNALYKVMFDARREIRASLVAEGLIEGQADAR